MTQEKATQRRLRGTAGARSEGAALGRSSAGPTPGARPAASRPGRGGAWSKGVARPGGGGTGGTERFGAGRALGGSTSGRDTTRGGERGGAWLWEERRGGVLLGAEPGWRRGAPPSAAGRGRGAASRAERGRGGKRRDGSAGGAAGLGAGPRGRRGFLGPTGSGARRRTRPRRPRWPRVQTGAPRLPWASPRTWLLGRRGQAARGKQRGAGESRSRPRRSPAATARGAALYPPNPGALVGRRGVTCLRACMRRAPWGVGRALAWPRLPALGDASRGGSGATPAGSDGLGHWGARARGACGEPGPWGPLPASPPAPWPRLLFWGQRSWGAGSEAGPQPVRRRREAPGGDVPSREPRTERTRRPRGPGRRGRANQARTRDGWGRHAAPCSGSFLSVVSPGRAPSAAAPTGLCRALKPVLRKTRFTYEETEALGGPTIPSFSSPHQQRGRSL
uniref:collagen alpha-2(I) chain-like n=1 Tax=Callithrix jacchus TaxID=9483 RepID=UPI0023DD431F|nr:collagen alpha-2(I) chain-like [Callithrix jacchus]